MCGGRLGNDVETGVLRVLEQISGSGWHMLHFVCYAFSLLVLCSASPTGTKIDGIPEVRCDARYVA